MSNKRKDSKGRLLKTGEYQRKDGTYEYKYTDGDGKRVSIYSKRLTPSDKCGEEFELSLREKILNIRTNSAVREEFVPPQHTFEKCYKEYIASQNHLKPTTVASYNTAYRVCLEDTLGKIEISKLSNKDVRDLFCSLSGRISKSYATIVRAVIQGTVGYAVSKDLIEANPITLSQREMCKAMKGTEGVFNKALTIEQQNAFISYIKSLNRKDDYCEVCLFMMSTGCRIGETTGLCWDDIDFVKNTVTIRRTLSYTIVNNKRALVITTPKSSAGERTIPMVSGVVNLLSELKDKRKTLGFCTTVVDGVSNFVFTSSDNSVAREHDVNRFINRSIKKYNQDNPDSTLPLFTSHAFRHTFCTRLCETVTDLKAIQTIMGHSNISITMNIYNNITERRVAEAMAAMDDKVEI